jgi:dolichol-phosphate mannosyltransferase
MALLTVVVPTFNEASNVALLISRLEHVLRDIDWDVIFVDDDSPDGTSRLARRFAQQKPHVHVIQRIGRQGLGSACIEGMLASSSPYVAVMDGDLQHDESILPQMLDKLRTEDLDIVVGSRNVAGGGMGEFEAHRQWLSDAGRKLSQLVCRCGVRDPMSGFFMLDRRFLDLVVRRLSGTGFKILVDLLASSPRSVRFAEVPYKFRQREHGESKLGSTVLIEYLCLIADKFLGDYVPFRFVLFAAAGLGGLALHLTVLGVLHLRHAVDFLPSQAIATLAAMTVNFLLNNWLTFQDRRLRGWSILKGLASFYLACSIGALTSLALAKFLYTSGIPWYLAGVLGTVVSSVWNYSVTSVFIWRRGRVGRVDSEPGDIPATQQTSEHPYD